jgi:hypothetical protein
MSSIIDNVEKSTVTSKSVMEKLKSLSRDVTKKTVTGIEDISYKIEATPTIINDKSTVFTIFRYIVVILLILFILLNVFAVFGILPPDIIKLFRPILFFLNPSPGKVKKQVYKKPVTLKEDETIETSTETPIDIIEKDIKHELKELKDLVVPEEDSSSRDIQKHKSKAGFCYVGEDRGYRSCVEVSHADICMSGDIFPTREVCVNPSLRM